MSERIQSVQKMGGVVGEITSAFTIDSTISDIRWNKVHKIGNKVIVNTQFVMPSTPVRDIYSIPSQYQPKRYQRCGTAVAYSNTSVIADRIFRAADIVIAGPGYEHPAIYTACSFLPAGCLIDLYCEYFLD